MTLDKIVLDETGDDDGGNLKTIAFPLVSNLGEMVNCGYHHPPASSQ